MEPVMELGLSLTLGAMPRAATAVVDPGYVGGSIVEDEPLQQKITTADGTPNSSDTTLADAENLGLTVEANKNYVARWIIFFTSAAGTTGIGLSVNGPAAPTAITAVIKSERTTAVEQSGVITAYETVITNSAATAGANNQATIEMSLRNGANAGTVIPRFRSEIDTSAITIKAGSFGQIWEVT